MDHTHNHRLSRVKGLAALILAIGLVGSAITSYMTARINARDAQAALTTAANEATDDIVERLRHYDYGLRGARGAIVAAGENGMSRETFHRYSLTRDLQSEFPGAIGFGFIRRVPEANEQAFVARAKADVGADFEIRQFAPHEGELDVVMYVEPENVNRGAIGRDIASDDDRRQAAVSAMRNGTATLTGPIALIQIAGDKRQSFLFLLPVYRTPTLPPTASEREAAAFGWTYAPLMMEGVLDGLDVGQKGLHLQLDDVTVPNHASTFYTLGDESHDVAQHFSLHFDRAIYGRTWRFTYGASSQFIANLHQTSPGTVMLVGSVISALTAAIAYAAGVAVRRRRQAEARIVELNASLEAQVAQRTSELRRLNMLFENVLRSASEVSIIATDLDGTINLFNHGAQRLLGYDAGEVVGRMTPLGFHDAGEIAAHEAALSDTCGEHVHGFRVFTLKPDRDGAESREWTYVRKDGSRVPVSLVVTAMRAESGERTGYLCIAIDITAQYALEHDLRKSKELADAANSAKSAFLANMSHEIRTPMNGIIGMTRLCLDTHLDEEQREYLTMVLSSAQSLLTVINDILDFSKIEAGKMLLDPVDFSLRTMITEMLRATTFKSGKTHVEILSDIGHDVPESLVGDAGRLRQVLTNLVGNALKFTSAGEIKLSVHVDAFDSSNVSLHFAVTDTGVGIAQEHLERIFDSFSQADSSTTRRYGGTGLGLAISSRLVAMLGGHLRVQSTVGVGSAFDFTLPFRLGQQPSQLHPTLPQSLHDVPVLVVDDNLTNLRLMNDTLLNFGMRPTCAIDAQSALDALGRQAKSREPFTIALVDGQLPDCDDYSLALEICGNPAFRETRVLVLSSLESKLDSATLQRAGISGFMTKPVDQSEVFNSLVKILGDKFFSAPSSADDPTPAGTESASNKIARRLRVLVVEDNTINQRLALRILERLGHDTRLACNGRDALDWIGRQPFDIVLMDVQMPEMDGLAATRALRARELQDKTGHLPVIAMTAHAMQGDQERCLAAGMDGYVSKPIVIEALVAEMERVIRMHSKERPGSEQPRAPLFDRQQAISRLGGDAELFRELAELLVNEAGQKRAEIETALVGPNLLQLARIAHKLKGDAGTFASAELTNAANDMERAAREGRVDAASEASRQTSELLEQMVEDVRTQVLGEDSL